MERADADGFTLMELMVVLLVAGILVAVAVPSFRSARDRSQDAAARADLATVLRLAAAAPDLSPAARTAAWLVAQDGSLVADTGPSTGPGRLSWYASDAIGVGAAVRSRSGLCLGGTVDLSGVVTMTEIIGGRDGISLHECTGASAAWFARQQPVQTPVGTVVVGPNGHGYEVVTTTLTWTQAAAAAASRQWRGRVGHLATITSPEEQVVVRSLATPTFAPWIGATDRAAEGTWTWEVGPESGTAFVDVVGGVVTGRGAAFHAFRSTQPNDSGGGEDCAVIERFASAKSVWNDLNCELGRHFVVEYS